jgi:hypothetical protein
MVIHIKKKTSSNYVHNEVFKQKKKISKLLCVFIQRLRRKLNENVIMIILDS